MFKVITAQENRFQTATRITDHNLLIEKKFAEDHRAEETHKFIHKTYIVDQKFRKTKFEIINQD